MRQTKTICSSLLGFELNALLEITEAINNNLSEASLYKIYHFTLLADLKVRKLSLFVFDDQGWDCKVYFGINANVCQSIDLERFQSLQRPESIAITDELYGVFENIIPVLHKSKLLALIFVGGFKESEAGFLGKSVTTFLEALTNIILVAIENKKMARRQLEQEALKKELEIAKQVQRYLIPKNLPDTSHFQVSAFYQPHHTVGGDYYDYIEISDNLLLLCIADVSGKGVPAALMMSNFQASLRTLVRQTSDLKIIVSELNYQIKLSGNGEIFITFFVALYDSKARQIRYMNCGHNPSLIKINDGDFEELKLGTTVLGMFNPLPFSEEGTIDKVDKFFLFNYTDGLNEAINPTDDEFGEEMIYQILEESESLNPKDVNKKMMNAVDVFRKGQDYRDDVTIFSAKLFG